MKKLKQNKDLIIIVMFSLVISILLFIIRDFREVYILEKLNSVLLPIFGVFLGGLITSYTILIALNRQIPNEVKETKAYPRINKYFVTALYSILLLIILNISFYFVKNVVLLLIQIFLSVFSVLMIAYIIFTIYKLFSLTH